jgi:hypothetical protein
MIRREGFLALVFLVTITCSAAAQYDFGFSGYAMNLAAYQRLSDQFDTSGRNIFSNILRLRLRPSLTLWEGASITIEDEVAVLYHTSPLFLQVQSSGNSRQVAKLSWTPASGERVTVIHFIDRLYLTQRFGAGDFVLGRQRIAWGSGRIWNPTDLFNPINPANVAKIEKDGVDALSAKLHIGDFTDVHAVINPRRNASANFGARFRGNAGEYDFCALGGRFDDRLVAGADVTGNFFTAGIRGEGIVSADPHRLRSNFARFIIGLDYQFTPELYALVEYQHNGEGKADRNAYELDRLIGGEILTLGRQYFAISANFLVHPLVSASALATANLADGSTFMNLTVSWSVTDDLSLALGAQYFRGVEKSEYGYYPSGVNLKTDVFF